MTEEQTNTGHGMIYNLVYAPVHENITNKINTTLHTVQNGIVDKDGDGKQDQNASFWDSIKAFFTMLVFSLAKMFGFEGGLAKMFGMPIPETKEVDALSDQVAQTVEQSLSVEKITAKTRDEFKQDLHHQLLGSLHSNRQKYPSFSNEHLEETAARTVENIMQQDQFKAAFNADGTIKGDGKSPFTHILASAKFYDVFSTELSDPKNGAELKQKLTMLSGGGEFGTNQIAQMSSALAPALVYFNDKANQPTNDLARFQAVSAKFNEALKTSNITWSSDQARELVADHVAARYMQSEHRATIPADFTTAIEQKEKGLVKTMAVSMLRNEVDSAIKDKIVSLTIKEYDDRKGWFMSDIDDDVTKLKASYYSKSSDGSYVLRKDLNEQEKIDLAIYQSKVCAFAVSKGKAPNAAQHKEIVDTVTNSIITTLETSTENNPSNLATTIGANVSAALKNNHTKINKLGVVEKDYWPDAGYSMDDVNKNSGNVYDLIGTNLTKLLQEDTRNQKLIINLQKSLAAPRVAAAQSAVSSTSYIPSHQYEYTPATHGKADFGRDAGITLPA